MAKAPKDKRIVVLGDRVTLGKPSKAKFRTARRDGKSVRLRVIDADSPTFAADFLASFAANVRRARIENREADAD